jgi:hypothetical protein
MRPPLVRFIPDLLIAFFRVADGRLLDFFACGMERFLPLLINAPDWGYTDPSQNPVFTAGTSSPLVGAVWTLVVGDDFPIRTAMMPPFVPFIFALPNLRLAAGDLDVLARGIYGSFLVQRKNPLFF